VVVKLNLNRWSGTGKSKGSVGLGVARGSHGGLEVEGSDTMKQGNICSVCNDITSHGNSLIYKYTAYTNIGNKHRMLDLIFLSFFA
jgi:hypothetical protein